MEPGHFLIVESMRPIACFFQPAIDGIPGDALNSRDRGLIEAFDTKSGNLVKGRSPMLESIVKCSRIGAERLLASLTPVSTTLPPPGLIKTKTDDVSGNGFS